MTETPPPAAPRYRNPVVAGIGYTVLAVAVFSCLNVIVKQLGEHYPPNQIAFFRNAVGMIPVLIMVRAAGGLASVRTGVAWMHALRGYIGVASMSLMFLSYHLLPLADAVAISFAGPLLITAMSVPLLGEKVGVHRWSAVLIGFGGVLIMVQPQGGGLGGGIAGNLGSLTALSAVVLFAIGTILMRMMSRQDTSLTIVFWFHVHASLLSGASLLVAWETPSLPDLGLLMILGLVGGVGQYWFVQGFRLAPVAVASPFGYSAILFSTVLGYVFFDEVPTPAVMAGAVVVIASGLYILYRETRRRSPVVADAGPSSGG